jgi:hypothetical protein
MTQKCSALLACAFIASGVITTATAHGAAQDRVAGRPNLSGSWQLNRDLSDDAKTKLESMHSSQPAGGHGPGRHGGLGRIFGGIFGRGHSGHTELEEVVVNAPTRFVVMQDDQKVILTEPEGRVRTLPTNNRNVKVDGRDTRTKWENNHLISEITVGDAKVIETYERSPSSAQLIVTARVDMQGRQVSIRRIYESVSTNR